VIDRCAPIQEISETRTLMVQAEMIRADWKLSDVEKNYPDAIEELARISPDSGKMRSSHDEHVRKQMVTVEQAAQIAGLDIHSVVARLNRAAGIYAPTAVQNTPKTADSILEQEPEPPWLDHANICEQLDVRPYQKRGEEPFTSIMTTATRVPVGKILSLRNTFEPVPLYGVLGNKGFRHWAVQYAQDDWEIYFYRAGPQPQTSSAGPAPSVERPDTESSEAWTAPTATISIDVSELVPPEPMIKILEALEEMESGSSLLVNHVRRPMHLYPRLDELGYSHETHEVGPGHIQVLIRKPAGASGMDR
jgi:uncharacterized protein (DUF2249 family)